MTDTKEQEGVLVYTKRDVQFPIATGNDLLRRSGDLPPLYDGLFGPQIDTLSLWEIMERQAWGHAAELKELFTPEEGLLFSIMGIPRNYGYPEMV